jgi:formamidopyrimidine-DNA glycosylase
VPELPEVETVRRTLQPAIGGEVAAVWDSGKGLHMRRKPPRARLRKLVDAHITDIRRHGKYLFVDFDSGSTLLVHLGMTGRFLIVAEGTPRSTHTHLVLWLADGRELRFVDARRFGQLDVFPTIKPPELGLGPDPIVHGIDVGDFLARAKKRTSPLKAFVLDQSVLAGVGNIYASEALWRARLRPTMRAHKLTTTTAARLADAINEVLRHALEHNGTTLRDFVSAEGAAGENADYLWVYGRAGEPCPRCRNAIKRAVHQGRATYYCPTCQTP